MATESLSHITEGALGSEGIVIESIADEADIPIWGPVIMVAAGTGEDLPRVEPIDTAYTQTVLGVAVD